MVVLVVDGERRTIEPVHISQEDAERAASSIDDVAKHWDGAAVEEDAHPETYPGD